MKDLKSPGYTRRREYTPCHAVPGHGICPECGNFCRVQHSAASAEFRTQYRYCTCGNSFQTVIRRASECR